jgi:RNA polymerase sigma factor (sigma-70 family)
MPLGPAFAGALAAARTGADWAWAEIYRDLAPAVLGYFRAHRAVDAEDLTSEVFVSMVRNIGSFEGDEDQFRSWVFVIVHRRLQDERRRHARKPVTPVETERLDRVADTDVEAEALHALSTARVRETFAQLSDDQRDVLTMRIIADLSLEDTALVLGKTVGAIKSLQHRGLAAVAKILSALTVVLP